MTIRDRLRTKAIEAILGDTRGRLVYVDAQGVARDLGAFTPAELESFEWAVGVAYRLTRERSERTRLAGVRVHASRLSRAIRKV